MMHKATCWVQLLLSMWSDRYTHDIGGYQLNVRRVVDSFIRDNLQMNRDNLVIRDGGAISYPLQKIFLFGKSTNTTEERD